MASVYDNDGFDSSDDSVHDSSLAVIPQPPARRRHHNVSPDDIQTTIRSSPDLTETIHPAPDDAERVYGNASEASFQPSVDVEAAAAAETSITSSTQDPRPSCEEEKPDWDLFKSTEREDVEVSKKCYKRTKIGLKIFTYFFMLVSIVILTMINKATLLLAANNLRPFADTYSLQCAASKGPDNYTECVEMARGKSEHSTVVYVNESVGCLTASHISRQCPMYRALWAWSLFLMVCLPYAFVCTRCLWNIAFRKIKFRQWHWPTFLAVMITETLHAVGICILVFLILPSLDNVIEGLLFMLGLSLMPGLMKILYRAEDEDVNVERNRQQHEGRLAFIEKCSGSISRLLTPNVMFIVDCVAFAFQISIIPLCITLFVIKGKDTYDLNLIWEVLLAPILISVRYWENFVDKRSRFELLAKHVTEPLKNIAKKSRQFRNIYQLLANALKILVTFLLLIPMSALQVGYAEHPDPWSAIFNFDAGWLCKPEEITSKDVYQMELDWVWLWLTNVCSSLVCYFFVRSAVKIRVQRVSFALAIYLTTPLMFIILSSMCAVWTADTCSYMTDAKAGYLFFKCFPQDGFGEVIAFWWLAILWYLSQLILTRHLWREAVDRLAPTDRLFLLPLYDVILEQSLSMNRTRDDNMKSTTKVPLPTGFNHTPGLTDTTESRRAAQANIACRRMTVGYITDEERIKSIPHVYACVTVWHEKPEEMVTMLSSILKLDQDQWSKEKAYVDFNLLDKYYTFEAHLFVDGAMTEYDEPGSDYKTNEFVHALVDLLNKAAQKVYKCIDADLGPPTKYPTPYGGRLEWTLPGGNTLTAHLKDSAKIRHKKRWSQVMYMYYFLGHKLVDMSDGDIRAANTFILALDGDIDFEPEALSLLVDLMRHDPKVGAACGRIHPTGSGPLVWYQRFEYALGHWMQKATEHVIGCVLCSPGCFSLFRGSALMDDNVMSKYTTKATKPIHYIQYDQGEDRWLCTLLLQQGYRVEYCAASDSFTCAPDDFNEFFNQRRRWIPSTMANVLDLILSCRHTVRVNGYISYLYILYQLTLLVVSIVGPATIFMMMTGALQLAIASFISINLFWSCFINLIPIVIFVFLCFFTSANVQLGYAKVLAVIYCLVQVLVLVGICVQIALNNNGNGVLCDPNTLFLVFVASTFLLCGLLHPMEILSLVHSFAYYLAIPTMYMILMIYSMCNLHIVAWGTREVKKTPTAKQREEERKHQEELKKLAEEKQKMGMSGRIYAFFGVKNAENEKPNFWRRNCGCCCNDGSATEAELRIQSELIELKSLIKRQSRRHSRPFDDFNRTPRSSTNEQMEFDDSGSSTSSSSDSDERTIVGDTTAIDEGMTSAPGDRASLISHTDSTARRSSARPSHDDGVRRSSARSSSERRSSVKVIRIRSSVTSVRTTQVRDELVNPAWLKDERLRNGPVRQLDTAEITFFQTLISRYLMPLTANKEEDKEEQEKLEMTLRDLRNKVSLSFLLVNGIFVILLFVLESYTELLGIPWFCGEDDAGNRVKIDPLGFTFMLVYGIIMVIQIAGMVTHRLGTFLHIMATTKVRILTKEDEHKEKPEDIISWMKVLGRPGDDADDDNDDNGGEESWSDSDTDRPQRPSRPRHNLNKRRRTTTVTLNFDENYTRRRQTLAGLNDDVTPEEMSRRAGIRPSRAQLQGRQSEVLRRISRAPCQPNTRRIALNNGSVPALRQNSSNNAYDEIPVDAARRHATVRFQVDAPRHRHSSSSSDNGQPSATTAAVHINGDESDSSDNGHAIGQ